MSGIPPPTPQTSQAQHGPASLALGLGEKDLSESEDNLSPFHRTATKHLQLGQN